MSTTIDKKLYTRAKQLVVKTKNPSVSFMQRKLNISYTKAFEVMNLLEKNNIVSVLDNGIRKVNWGIGIKRWC